eukprot:g1793.t1
MPPFQALSPSPDASVGDSDVFARYTTARAVFYAESIVGIFFSSLLVIALHSAASAASFRKHNVKAAFRLTLLCVAAADLMQSAAVIAYLFDLPPGNDMRTQSSTLACVIGAILSSTGEIASTLFTACLAVEGHLIIVKGVRTGERRRAQLYVGLVLLTVTIVQTLTATQLGFGNVPDDNKLGNYVWCHVEIRTTAGELLSFYLWLILGLIVSLVCYVQMECKLRAMLKVEGVDDSTKRTIQRSRCKFFSFPIIFMIAWVPTGIHRLVWSGGRSQTTVTKWILLYVSALAAGGLPIMNAIAYGYFNQEIRPDVENFCNKLCCRGRKYGIRGSVSSRFAGRAHENEDEDTLDSSTFSLANEIHGDDLYGSDDDDLPPMSFYNDDDREVDASLLR